MLRGIQLAMWSQLQWMRTAPTHTNKSLNLYQRNGRAVSRPRRAMDFRSAPQSGRYGALLAPSTDNEMCRMTIYLPHLLGQDGRALAGSKSRTTAISFSNVAGCHWYRSTAVS